MDSDLYASEIATATRGSELAFPQATYDQRVSAVRSAMAEIGLDTLLVTDACDLNYLAGYDTLGVDIYACLVLPIEGEPILHTMTVEIPAASATTWVNDLVFLDWFLPANTGNRLAAMLTERNLDKGRIGLQPGRMGLRPDVHGHLEAGLNNASLVDTTDLVARLRLIKSHEEIECLRKAAQITAAGIDASLAILAPGISDNDICRAGFDAMLAAGSDFLSIQPIVTTGIRTGGGHQTHRRNRVHTGDPVFMEYGGCFKRYTAPMMRSAVLGPVNDEMRRIEDAAKETTQTMIENIRPGRSAHEIAVLAKHAHRDVNDRCWHSGAYGYTIGVGYPPTWAETIGFIAEGVDEELMPGMTFHLPTALRTPGRCGVSLSESVLVTDSGCEVLTNYPRCLRTIEC